MIAREAVLNNPEIVALLRRHFVPIAVDNVANLNMTEAEKGFLSEKGLKSSTQGMSVFTAGGRVLATNVGLQPGPVKTMLLDSLRRYQSVARSEPRDVSPLASTTDAREQTAIYQAPEGGLVLYVTWKVVGNYGRTQSSLVTENGQYDKLFRDALGVDRLWVRKDEADLLAQGTFPESLKNRMIPHLSDAFVGKVESLEVLSREGHLAGRLRSDTGDRGCLRGLIAAKDGRVSHLIMVAKGWGERSSNHGFSACLEVIPSGRKVPVAVLFTLADPRDDLSRVPPRRCKDDGYLR